MSHFHFQHHLLGKGIARAAKATTLGVESGDRTICVAVIEPIPNYEVKRGKELGDICADRELERPVDFCELPHSAHTPEIGFESVENLDPSTMDRLSIVGPHIYTDGSRIEGKVCAALTEWREGTESENSAYRLKSFCTVFQAEMFALHRVIGRVKKGSIDWSTHLQGVRLFWVRAYTGTASNERADELARNAALRRKTAADYDRFPLSYSKKAIRARSWTSGNNDMPRESLVK
ncbi:hypothetical protein EVAR_77500_1 [Eumeta japonica]|uniref:RNase H type-1 domain-containing protein n=1 Tax=Eumeta variegata TaxID=151549 RepID=A0A4C1T789_EUMVA|nr:hypothetical protein EVAR_77500_1 [Eumeta japonica]